MRQNETGQAGGLPCSQETGGPRHIAIIMDGNGRWATRRGLPRTAGHKAGAETFRRIATYCKNIGVQYLTVYAFSTENWKRSESEVGAIMLLLKKYLLEAVDTMERDHIRLHFFGDMTPIAPELRALARETDEITEHLSKDDFQANVCLNYGGRDEILRAARRFAADCAAGEKRPEDWMRPSFPAIWTPGDPDPELNIRPSGSCGFPTSCCGSAPLRSFILPTCSGRTSMSRAGTGPLQPTGSGPAVRRRQESNDRGERRERPCTNG
jgi:undecaprenyl diphosphate synthase